MMSFGKDDDKLRPVKTKSNWEDSIKKSSDSKSANSFKKPLLSDYDNENEIEDLIINGILCFSKKYFDFA